MCTIIAKGNLIGKNYDSIIDQGILFTNKRGLMKQGAIFPPKKPLEWVSCYGSLTFSQSGKEFPTSGINEKGLVVEQATLLSTIYPENTGKPEASCLETTQYLLDTCSSVEEALIAMEGFAVAATSWPIHFALFDRSGTDAVIEYLHGEMHVYRNQKSWELILTNTEYLNSRVDSAGHEEAEQDLETVECVFQALKQATRPDTIWSNVYDLVEMTLYLKVNETSGMVKINLRDIDLSPQSQSLMLKIHEDAKRMVDYREEDNRDLISGFFRDPEIKRLMNLTEPEVMIDFVANQAKNYDAVNEIMVRFLDGDQIKQLPVKESHKRYVLKYLASKFQRDEAYSEAQVNQIIDQWHTFGDYFILRRSLVDCHLLARLPNGAKYWRE